MKKGLVLALIFGVFFVNSAIAGPANIAGDWHGTGKAILPISGDTCEFNVDGDVFQDGTLLYGSFEFDLTLGTCTSGVAEFTGNISAGNEIKAMMSVEGFGGIGVMDAKLMGKTISGVVLDFSDGSTTIFSVTPEEED